MNRRTKLGLAVAVVCMLGSALAAGSAGAATIALPEFSAETTFTGTAGKTKFAIGATEVQCANATDSGTSTSKKTGTFKFEFKECTLAGSECHATGSGSGVVPISGEYKLADAVGGTPESLLLLAVTEVHVECKFLGTSIRMKGSLLGQLTPTDTLTKSFEAKIHASEGKQEFGQYENENAETVVAKLEASVNGGAFVSATEVQVLAAPPAPTVEKVDFTNTNNVVIDHRLNVVPEKALTIGEYGAKNSTEWETGTNAKNWPLSFKEGATMKLDATFKVPAATVTFLLTRLSATVNTRLVGETTVDGVAIQFLRELTLAQVKTQLEKPGSPLETEAVNALSALANKVTGKKMKIAWRWEVTENGRALPYRQRSGESEHNLFVTHLEPRGTVTPYFTLLDIATQGIEKAAPTEAEVITGTWKGFEAATGPTVHFRVYEVATGSFTRT